MLKKSFEERMTQLNGFTEKDIKTPEVLVIEIEKTLCIPKSYSELKTIFKY